MLSGNQWNTVNFIENVKVSPRGEMSNVKSDKMIYTAKVTPSCLVKYSRNFRKRPFERTLSVLR